MGDKSAIARENKRLRSENIKQKEEITKLKTELSV